jgi:hypothetical protein
MTHPNVATRAIKVTNKGDIHVAASPGTTSIMAPSCIDVSQTARLMGA